MPNANKAQIARDHGTTRSTVYGISTGAYSDVPDKASVTDVPKDQSGSRVLAFSCTHYPVCREGFVDFLLDVKKKWKCNRVVHLGDLVDLHSVSFHENDPDLYAPGAEINLTVNQMRNTIYKALPKLDIITGNHDVRIHRKAFSTGLPARAIQNLANIYDTPRGWTWHPQFSKVCIDGVNYSHGDSGRSGKHPACLNAEQTHRSVVQGHFHHCLFANYIPPNADRLIFGVQAGCGLDSDSAAMRYGLKFNQKPALGCAVIVDGRHAYVERMVL